MLPFLVTPCLIVAVQPCMERIPIKKKKKKKKCQHPLHTKAGKCNTRTATFSQISCLQQNFPENHFPIGCQLCMTHIKETNKMMKVREDNDNSMVSEYTEIFEAEALS